MLRQLTTTTSGAVNEHFHNHATAPEAAATPTPLPALLPTTTTTTTTTSTTLPAPGNIMLICLSCLLSGAGPSLEQFNASSCFGDNIDKDIENAACLSKSVSLSSLFDATSALVEPQLKSRQKREADSNRRHRRRRRHWRRKPLSPFSPDDHDQDQKIEESSASVCLLKSNAADVCVTYRDVERALSRARSSLGGGAAFGNDEDSDDNDGDDYNNQAEPSEANLSAVGELVEATTRVLARRFALDWAQISFGLPTIDMSQTSLWRQCPLRGIQCIGIDRYRSHNGLCNNLHRPYAGASNTAFLRFLPPDYADGVGAPRGFLTDSSSTVASWSSSLPEPRLVSRLLHPDVRNAALDVSVAFVAFGQILNHDLALAVPATAQNGFGYSCCGARGTRLRRKSCMPIRVDRRDPLYAPAGVRCMDFKRSLAGLSAGCSLGPRTPLNGVTSFIDANFVYGSGESQASALRNSGNADIASRGQLRVWNYFRNSNKKPLLPPQLDSPDTECVNRRPPLYCFSSGDRRVNQQVHLTVLHTIHVRHHNRLAFALATLNPHWQDARVYHEARHIHIAQLQHILLSEYLPTLLGEQQLNKYSLNESPGFWDNYEPNIDAGISAAFAAAAFRSGHSMVPADVFRFDALHRLVRGDPLRDFYLQPWPLFEEGALDEFLLGQLNAPAETNDPFVADDLAGHLLQAPDEQVGLDLASINIQRGRDHGLPGYNHFRHWCNLGRVESFADLSRHMPNRSAYLMAQLYASVDDIDLFVGGLSEFWTSGAQVGPTFACIIGRQFQRLRFGDRFWFESSRGPQAFSAAQLDSIKSVPLSRILCANADYLPTIQRHAFGLPHPVFNERLPCEALPELDMSLWRDFDASYG